MRVTLNGEVIHDDYQWLYDYFHIAAFSPGVIRQAPAGDPGGGGSGAGDQQCRRQCLCGI